MPFLFADLEEVRDLALSELEADIGGERVYSNPERMTPAGIQRWPGLLADAIMGNGVEWLKSQIRLGVEYRRRIHTSRGPRTMGSHDIEMLCEGEFNRYYVRGVCLFAIENGLDTVEVYRGKVVSSPRAQSERLIGQALDPERLLTDLRQNVGVETALGVPAGPNSGLTVRLVRDDQ